MGDMLNKKEKAFASKTPSENVCGKAYNCEAQFCVCIRFVVPHSDNSQALQISCWPLIPSVTQHLNGFERPIIRILFRSQSPRSKTHSIPFKSDTSCQRIDTVDLQSDVADPIYSLICPGTKIRRGFVLCNYRSFIKSAPGLHHRPPPQFPHYSSEVC